MKEKIFLVCSRYIVVNGHGQPMTRYPKELQFCCFSNVGVTFFPRGDYEVARKLVGWHYKTLHEQRDVIHEKALEKMTGLSIRRLTAIQNRRWK